MANPIFSRVKITNQSSASETVFEVSKAAVAQSDVLRDLLEDLFDGMDVTDIVIPIFIHGVGDDALHRVFAWMEWRALTKADAEARK
jgi:hypothetical protein